MNLNNRKSIDVKLHVATVNELIQTEQSYVNDLTVVVDIIQKPLLQQEIITKSDSTIIFSNISLLKDINAELLSALMSGTNIGQAFLPMVNLSCLVSIANSFFFFGHKF